jgi:Ca-activated chloride channel family protein
MKPPSWRFKFFAAGKICHGGHGGYDLCRRRKMPPSPIRSIFGSEWLNMRSTIRCTDYLSRVIAPAAAFVLLLVTGLAQNPRITIEPRAQTRGSAERTSTNIRVNSNLVLIPVTVTDHHERFVTGLEKDHFKLFEDKVEQAITHFAQEDAPISVGVVFDCSGSMQTKLDKSRGAVDQFLNTANPGDEFSLITFADRPELLVHFTENTAEIRDRLKWTRAEGRTALLDAIRISFHEMKNARNSRKALIIISDGGDNSSRYTTGEIKNLVREGDVQIYAVAIIDSSGMQRPTSEEMAGPALLSDIAGQSGGLLFEVNNWSQLPVIASKIGVALRNQYVLGYSPPNLRKDGKYHRVQVKLELPKGGPRLRASWRLGYYAPVQ